MCVDRHDESASTCHLLPRPSYCGTGCWLNGNVRGGLRDQISSPCRALIHTAIRSQTYLWVGLNGCVSIKQT